MGRIIYSPATRSRFREDALLALDALSRECGEVEICPPIPLETPYWEVAVVAAGHSRKRWSAVGVTLAEAAKRLASWKGVEVPPRVAVRDRCAVVDFRSNRALQNRRGSTWLP